MDCRYYSGMIVHVRTDPSLTLNSPVTMKPLSVIIIVYKKAQSVQCRLKCLSIRDNVSPYLAWEMHSSPRLTFFVSFKSQLNIKVALDLKAVASHSQERFPTTKVQRSE